MSWNRRKWTLTLLVVMGALLVFVVAFGATSGARAAYTDFSQKNLPPQWQYPFGTDWMGRDMFARTIAGLSMSMRIGLAAASVSAIIAFLLGTAAAMMGRAVDSLISWIIDLVMGIPHILLLILIAFACGKGLRGVVAGIVFTHWMSLARVVRGEVLQLKHSGYVQVATKLGVSRWRIARRHMAPHLLPQLIVGLILLFPHAILHEASITFLGFGLSPEQPAIGIILSESMRYLMTGQWWLAVLPGLSLMLVVALFDAIGSAIRTLLDPTSAHE